MNPLPKQDHLDPAIAAANKEMISAGLQIANNMAALFGSMAGATAAAMMTMAQTPPSQPSQPAPPAPAAREAAPPAP